MSLQRQIERNNLKKRNDELISQVRELVRMNDNLQRINDKMNKNIEALFNELKYSKDVITALTITDIRNHNYSQIEHKKVISIPYSFLNQVAKDFSLKMHTFDDVLIIEPIKKSLDEEGVTDDQTEQ
jgi:FtsZ-binding cell division protein ZapB